MSIFRHWWSGGSASPLTPDCIMANVFLPYGKISADMLNVCDTSGKVVIRLKILSIVSIHPGSGQTTIAINLASGLVRNGYRVLLIVNMNSNDKPGKWLGIDRDQHGSPDNQILTSRMGVDLLNMNSCSEDTGAKNVLAARLKGLDYDYVLFLPAYQSDSCLLNGICDYLIACTDLSHSNTVAEIISLENDFNDLTQPANRISLLVLNKINTKEWEHNSQQLFALDDYLGYERIADPIPYCERIHDLPLDGRTVWELSQQNLKDAFASLLETVEKLLPTNK